MNETLLSLTDVSIAFGGVKALDGVSLNVPRGAIFSLIGPNGAGKSTLFDCVTGLRAPDGGDIELERRSIRGLRPDRIARLGVARTFQNIELFSNMTTIENVLIGRHVHMKTGPISAMIAGHGARAEDRAHRRRSEEILAALNLGFARDQVVTGLPYGVQRRVEIARALALEPKLLMLDEPSAGMNAEERDDIARTLSDIRAGLGIAVLLVEHDVAMVMGISDRVAVLDHGRKIAEGAPSEILENPEVIRAYLGTIDEHDEDDDDGRTAASMP